MIDNDAQHLKFSFLFQGLTLKCFRRNTLVLFLLLYNKNQKVFQILVAFKK